MVSCVEAKMFFKMLVKIFFLFSLFEWGEFARGIRNSSGGVPNDRATTEMLSDAINLFIGKPDPPIRFAANNRELPSAAQCAQRCTRYMRECAHNEIPGFEKQIWSFQYEPNKLETYCQIHENGTECLNVCPDSMAKSLANNGMDIARQICNGSAIRTNARCITDVALESVCESQQKCGKYPMPEGQSIRPSSVDEFKQLTKQTCQRLKCNLDCASSSITERCGQAAERDVELVVRIAARYLKVLTDSIKVPRAFAEECGLLANLTILNTGAA